MKDQKKTTGTGNSDEAPKHELIVHSEKKWHEKVPKSVWLILLLIAVGFAFYYFSPRENGGGVASETPEQRELRELKAKIAQIDAQNAAPATSTGFAPPQGASQPEADFAPAQVPSRPSGPKKFTQLEHKEHGAQVLKTQPITRPDGSRWLLLHGPGGVVMYPVDRNRSAESIQRTMTWETPEPQPAGKLEIFDTTTHQGTGRAMHVYAWRLR